jgi:hypothetical protein
MGPDWTTHDAPVLGFSLRGGNKALTCFQPCVTIAFKVVLLSLSYAPALALLLCPDLRCSLSEMAIFTSSLNCLATGWP